MLTTCARIPCVHCEASEIACEMRSKNRGGCKACKKAKIWCEYRPEKEIKGDQATPEAVEAATALIALGEIAERSDEGTPETPAQIEIAESTDALGRLSIADPAVATQGGSGERANPR
jgi:hypothetical protein